MDIYVMDGVNGIIGLIDTYNSVIWNVQYFGKNDFQLVTAANDANMDLLQEGRLLVRESDIKLDSYNNVMLIEKVQIDLDSEKGWLLTVTGKGLKNLLSRRVVWSQITSTGTVETTIRQAITDNAINPTDPNRAIPNLVLDSLQGFTDTADIQLLGENLAEWLESICTTYGYGWDIYIKNHQFVFKLYQGTDRSYNQSSVVPVVFSPEYDNLLSSSYSYDKSGYINAALIGGEGQGTAKRTASIGTAAGLARFETYVDGSSVSSNGEIITVEEYTALLESYGKEQIAGSQITKSFDGEVIPDGLYKLNTDYFLGDVVQIQNEKGISATPRIIEIIYADDENGTSVVPTFSEWEVD